MRKINRLDLDKKTSNNLKEKEKKLLQAIYDWENSRKIKELQKGYALTDVKRKLELMQDFDWEPLCCYCETKKGGSPLEIEHIKPKWKPWYEKFTFDWNNLLYSCRSCNWSYKQDNYVDWFLNPSKDNYSFDDNFDFNEECFYINKNTNAEITSEILKLNDKWKHSFSSRLQLCLDLQKNLEEYKKDWLPKDLVKKYLKRDLKQKRELETFWNWLFEILIDDLI